MPVVLLPASLVTLFPGSDRRVEVVASDVASALAALDCKWPGMKDRLVDSRPAIRRHIALYVGNEPARLDTLLAADAELIVVPAISGG